MYNIEMQNKKLINTDRHRRCYNGCMFSCETIWSDWERLESNIPDDKIERRLQFWKELNDYAVSERGEGARTNYRKVEII